MTPITRVLALCVLSSVLLQVCLAGWQNSWDRPHFKPCDNGNYIRRIKSTHNNDKEDRLWEVFCGRVSNLAADQSCSWTGEVNNWDDFLLFNCPNNGLISGVWSHHDNNREDRRFRFRCCGVSGRKPSNCGWTGYVNDWDSFMDYSAPGNKVITGAFSYHDNKREDRRWRFMICDI